MEKGDGDVELGAADAVNKDDDDDEIGRLPGAWLLEKVDVIVQQEEMLRERRRELIRRWKEWEQQEAEEKAKRAERAEKLNESLPYAVLRCCRGSLTISSSGRPMGHCPRKGGQVGQGGGFVFCLELECRVSCRLLFSCAFPSAFGVWVFFPMSFSMSALGLVVLGPVYFPMSFPCI